MIKILAINNFSEFRLLKKYVELSSLTVIYQQIPNRAKPNRNFNNFSKKFKSLQSLPCENIYPGKKVMFIGKTGPDLKWTIGLGPREATLRRSGAVETNLWPNSQT